MSTSLPDPGASAKRKTSCGRRILMLGAPQGWHADQLRAAARRRGDTLEVASYESLRAGVSTRTDIGESLEWFCESGSLQQYDSILTRTMPAGSFERITFRLAMLHAIADGVTRRESALPLAMINRPAGLEWAIDKFACLARLAKAGFATPPTRFVQSRGEAMQAFDELGGDCVVKPIFGGEGRGVMRVQDPELAWYTFSTLDQIQSVIQIQQFIFPGGRDTRLLVIGDRVVGLRRENSNDFRTNSIAGGLSRAMNVTQAMADDARRVARVLGLSFAAVDWIDNEHGAPMLIEVNAIPGWKAAQAVTQDSIADHVIEALHQEMEIQDR